ncbi:MAG TPA: hypothetical protein VLX09_02910 [Stellaceae bacterium]|nr:hypothetical protein [Stellaceae bacterium]
MTERSRPTLEALKELLTVLAGQILHNREEAAKLAAAMRHAEAVMRMLDPTFEGQGITLRRRYESRAPFKRGQGFSVVVDVLRASGRPLTARQIAEEILRQAGIHEPPIRNVREMVPTVHSTLRRHRGRSVETVGEESPVRWRLKGNGDAALERE